MFELPEYLILYKKNSEEIKIKHELISEVLSNEDTIIDIVDNPKLMKILGKIGVFIRESYLEALKHLKDNELAYIKLLTNI
ncbi:MAG: hypothetical protein ACP6IS_10105 [Candidatus Asgardarchaeia archaeon]